ncbi:hypothetical protein GCM10009565_87950 [Amycolatopsis albidoflavus]
MSARRRAGEAFPREPRDTNGFAIAWLAVLLIGSGQGAPGGTNGNPPGAPASASAISIPVSTSD